MAASKKASGRFVLRLAPSLHAQLRQVARTRGVSLNTLCTRLLGEAVAAEATGKHGAEPRAEPGWMVAARRLAEAWGDDVRGALVFGSAMRGELRAESDIDVLLVLDSRVPLHRGLYREWDELAASNTLGREINAHFVHLPQRVEDAGSLWLEVAVEGHALMDRDGQLVRTLIMLRRAIASGRFVRETAHGQPFWRRAA